MLVDYYEKTIVNSVIDKALKAGSSASKITSIFDSLYDQEYVRVFDNLEEQIRVADAELISVINVGEVACKRSDPVLNNHLKAEIVKLNGSLEKLYSAVESKEQKLREKLD